MLYWTRHTWVCSLILQQVYDHGSVQGTRSIVEDHSLGLLHRENPEHSVPVMNTIDKMFVTLDTLVLYQPIRSFDSFESTNQKRLLFGINQSKESIYRAALPPQ